MASCTVAGVLDPASLQVTRTRISVFYTESFSSETEHFGRMWSFLAHATITENKDGVIAYDVEGYLRATYVSQSQRPKTVLIVDNDPEWLASTCRVIGSEYPVLAATCGADAVRAAARAKPDLIVLDVMQLGTEGFPMLAELRRDPATRDMLVIVVSEVASLVGLGTGMASRARRQWHSIHAFVERSASCDLLMAAVQNAIGPSQCHGGREESLLYLPASQKGPRSAVLKDEAVDALGKGTRML